MYDVRSIGNYFINRYNIDNKNLHITSLLYIVYIASGWYIELTNGGRLFKNRIEAWSTGPVILDLYNSIKDRGLTIEEIINGYDIPDNHYVLNILDQIYNLYGHKTSKELSDIVKEENSPWFFELKYNGLFSPIGRDILLHYYKNLRDKSNKNIDFKEQ